MIDKIKQTIYGALRIYIENMNQIVHIHHTEFDAK